MATTDTKTMMPATVENLREILFNVEPPKRLVNRRSEMPLLVSPDGLELLKTPTMENLRKVMQLYFGEMVRTTLMIAFLTFVVYTNVSIERLDHRALYNLRNFLICVILPF